MDDAVGPQWLPPEVNPYILPLLGKEFTSPLFFRIWFS